MTSRCEYQMSSDLDSDLTVLSINALAELQRAVRTAVAASDYFAGTTQFTMWVWGVSLAILTHDVATSVHILATHDRVRAALILNRCLSEYRVRLDFYIDNPDAAVEDIAQFETEMRKVFQARSVEGLAKHLSDDQMKKIRDLVNEPNLKAAKRQIRSMFEEGFGDHAGALYGVHYAIGSSFVHGGALATGDVVQSAGKPDPKDYTINFTTNVFSLNTVLGEALIHVIGMLRSMMRLFQQHNDAELIAAAFDPILNRLEPAE